jgi:acetyl-CoA synthetase
MIDRYVNKGDFVMLKPGGSYDEIYDSFKWKIPEFFNMGVDICDKWAHQRYRLALVYENETGQVEKYTFWDLKRLSNGLPTGFRPTASKRGTGWGFCSPSRPRPASATLPFIKWGRW